MKRLCSILLSTFLLLSPTAAYANSAQTYFQGISATGTMVIGEQSPIIVERELLTFDLQEFPQEYYEEEADFLAYSGKVTAEYTFHNPADYDVKAKLAFPFGRTPDYGYSYLAADGEKYDILVDGEPVAHNIRHTLFYRGEEFQLEKDLSNLLDDYMEDPFWQFDTPVKKYSWEVSGIAEEFDAARLGFRWSGDASERKLMLMEQAGGGSDDDSVSVTRWVENGDIMELYVFGNPLEENLEWFSENGAEDSSFVYTLTFLGEETMTYEEYVFSAWEESSSILRHDWYNAVTQNLKNCEWNYGILGSFEYTGRLNPDDFLRWYEYEITIPAGETVVNTVTAPIYPALNTRYEPPIYAYTYLLSPAKTWADFGKLDIIVHTPYFMTESGGDFSFEKTGTGYQTSLDGLPDGELTFTLSESAKPKVPMWPLHALEVGCIAGAVAIAACFKLKKRK